MRRIICIILWHLGLRGAAYKVSPSVAVYLYGKENQEEPDGWRGRQKKCSGGQADEDI